LCPGDNILRSRLRIAVSRQELEILIEVRFDAESTEKIVPLLI